MYNEKLIEHLLKNNLARRWQKHNKDYVYLDWHKIINLDIVYDKNGDIQHSFLYGEKINAQKTYLIKYGTAFIDMREKKLKQRFMHFDMHGYLETTLHEINNNLGN